MTPTISKSLNILIMDDEVDIHKILSVCPETEGQRVLAVSNFEDALGHRLPCLNKEGEKKC
jgi:CheY-like chemotaxis protein